MCIVQETAFIEHLVENFPRSPRQINKLQESDAELLRLDGGGILAVTTDSMSEELERGLYTDPYHIGWMTVAVNLSDLAAVGASPLGILLNQTFTTAATAELMSEIQRGIAEACARYGCAVLGGDTNFSHQMQMSATAVGIVNGLHPLMRSGCIPGDLLYSSGKLGDGNAYAFAALTGSTPLPWFIPVPRCDEGRMLLKHASASIDTSDGFFAAVDQLMRVNGVGFTITTRADEYIADRALGLCDSARLPRWFMLAGPHGEYELVFTLHPENETAFLQEAGASAWHPVKLGAAVKECCISFLYDSRQRRVDTGAIRNIFARTDRGIDEYVKELSSIEQSWRRA